MTISKIRSYLTSMDILKQAYLILAIMILVPLILLAGLRHIQFNRTVEDIYRKRLVDIALAINSRLPDSFDEWTIKHDVFHSPAEIQVKAINSELQPIFEAISSSNPDIGMGIYSIELDSVIAFAPNFESSGLRSYPHTPFFSCLRREATRLY